MATGDQPPIKYTTTHTGSYVSVGVDATRPAVNTTSVGNVFHASDTGKTYLSTGAQWVQMTTAAPTTFTGTHTFTTTTPYNGDPSQRIFQTIEERIEYQQQAYEEPRDHAYNPTGEQDPSSRLQIDFFGVTCQDCAPHNVHRWDPGKHLFVIEEEVDIDWVLRLAS